MTNSRYRRPHIELGVRDLHQLPNSHQVWALEEVSADGDSIHFRATAASIMC